ncbi:MAG TPA: isoprenylcysteine carboxylmethyltransferase family protein [Candidatus Eisenbacteria bacterium]
MDSETPFRAALIAGAALVLPVAAFYRVRSQRAGDKLDRRQEGLPTLLTLRPAGLAAAVGLFAYMIDPASMAWASMPVPVWARWCGVGLAASGASLLIWTFHTLGPNLTDTVVTRRVHTLVTNGPFRWVRHPLYVATAILVLGNSLAAANWFLLAAGALVFTMMVVRTRREEAFLIARFGDSYREYMARTGPFLPR